MSTASPSSRSRWESLRAGARGLCCRPLAVTYARARSLISYSNDTLAIFPTEKVDKGPQTRPAPLAALGARELPTELHFRRDHFGLPAYAPAAIAVAGETEVTFELAELAARRPLRLTVVLECAGHRRAELEPPAAGVQWEVGAVSEAVWGGLPLRELLLAAGVPAAARTVVFHGTDGGRHAGTDLPVRFARAIPLGKALAPDTIVAWEMNGEPIPPEHGGPLRAIVPGHYAVDSVKWLERVTVLEREFDGPFQRFDYRFYTGDDDGTELHELPVSSLLVAATRSELSGVAWGGAGGVAAVEVSVDDNAWLPAALERRSLWGRVFWSLACELVPGRHAIRVRATDAAGSVQPDAPRWNRLGYANNSVLRAVVAVT